MRKNRPTRRSRINPFSSLFGRKASSSLRRAPRRRDVERLEERQVLSATVADNPYFEDQWNLDATGQQTEFDPTSPTRFQTLAEIDINVSDVWDQLISGAGVQVGIISGGFDLNHEDLLGAFATNLALDVFGGNTAYVDNTDTNGTAVAGIIGARNNDLGVVGIAYEAELVPIRAIADATIDPALVTPNSAAQALRWRLGLVQDADGDGIVDNGTTGFTADEVIDVYYVSGALSGSIDLTQGGGTDRVAPEVLAAIQAGANGGRGSWTDLDGDGIFDLDEATALGAIYVVPAGNENGQTFNFPFNSTGFRASSQYNELANSRYTIAVGAVDYDGRYENNATGTVTSFSEMGANVLLVAPSGTNQIDLAGDTRLNSGILTTDLTGEDGNNALPLPFFGEVDGGVLPNGVAGGDFFPDTNYTSTFSGTEAAAAQVTAVVAQMLEVNPNLSRRDVEQILLMSAQTNDQFDESWIINPYGYFQNFFDSGYVIPSYTYTDLDVGPEFDGDADIEDAVIPNGPFVNQDGGFANTNVYDPSITRSYFLNNPDLTIDTFSYGLVDPVGAVQALGRNYFQLNEISTVGVPTIHANIPENDRPGVRELISPTNLEEVPLQFTNGVGYTISHGRGRYLEEYGYAHGVLDAALAVELAQAWLPDASIAGDEGLYKPREVSITTPILDNNNSFLAIQGRADIATGRGTENFIIPGGINGAAINTGFYEEFTQPIEGTDVEIDGNKIGEVITGGPFYDPDGDLNFTFSDIQNEIRIPIDQSVDLDFLSLEWIELRMGIESGDADNLRISIVGPDGTQTELNPYVLPGGVQGPIVTQEPQFGQGSYIPNFNGDDLINGTAGGVTAGTGFGDRVGISIGDNFGDNGVIVDINAGSDIKLTAGITGPDRIPAGEAWTWTTNRHYGELFSVEAANSTPSEQDNISLNDGWELVLENWGGALSLTGVQLSFHGTEATGQRIQGRVGVDDNAQNIDFYNLPSEAGGAAATNPTPEQLGDGIFNFNRFVEFGEVVADPTPFFAPNTDPFLPEFLLLDGDETVYTVVVDDPNDAVDLSDLPGRAYRTIDPDTGIERVFPVVDLAAYMSANTNDLTSQLAEFDPDFGSLFVTTSLRRTDGALGHLQTAVREDAVVGLANVRVDGTPGTVRNFDYSQESFAAAETVLSTQYRVNYDNAGNPSGRIATGQFQRFVTGTDGNYYFDVATNPAPPDPSLDQAAYDDWFQDFGFTLEYDISISDPLDRLHDQAYTRDAQEDFLSQVSYLGDGVYTVQLFDATNVLNGQTTTVDEVNFLLAVDLTEVQLDASGTIVRDINGNAVNEVADGTDGTYAGITVYYDANDNNQLDAEELFTTSEADGSYQLMFDPGEDTEVSIRLDENSYPASDPLRPIAPLVAGEAELTLTGFDKGDKVVSDFFLKPTASIVTGTVWQDTDQNGAFDNGEVAIDGTQIGRNGLTPAVFVYHDVNQNNLYDDGIDTQAFVSATGGYQIEFTTPGSYDIRIDLTNSDVSLTFPTDNDGDNRVTVLAEEVLVDVNFGVKDLRVFDYGDLPDTYGTTFDSSSEGGARHRVTNTDFYLGDRLPDLELDGQPTVNADGDDNDGFDDEDGITLLSSTIDASGTIDFEIVAHGGSPTLNAWVDWNDDGVFTEDEQIFTDLGALGTGVATTITADVPALIETRGRYAARFRWGSAGLGPIGPANGGEVEDLWLIPDGATITGRVLRDIDNDAVFEDSIDTPIPGVRVFIDDNLNGIREPAEPSAVTDADGRYTFEVAVTATNTPITIRAEEATLPNGTTYLDPIDGLIAELVDPNETIVANFLLTVENRPDQSISGQVVRDADSAAGLSGGEDGLEGVTVQLLTNTDADPELEVVASTLTNVNGAYAFDLANTGDYEVRVDLPAITTLVLTTPTGENAVTVGIDDDITAATFGIYDRRDGFTRDYGDLRVGGGDNYPTTAADNGASHLVDGVTFLGNTVDADEGILSSGNATADDLDGVDDEDGVTLLTPQIVPNGPISFNVKATGAAGSVLNAWVDFDDNGVFEQDEQIVTNLALDSGLTTRINRTTNADTSTTADFLNTRFRWGTADVGPTGSTNSSGVDAIGEVEDHRIAVLMNPSGLAGDFDDSGLVNEADYDFWAATFGASVPAGTGADGNSDGRVDIADYTVWREAWELGLSGGTPALATSQAEEQLEPVSFTASAATPVGLGAQSAASALDESLAVTEDESIGGNAIDAALLEWSLEDSDGQDEEAFEAMSDDESNETEEADLAFESVGTF